MRRREGREGGERSFLYCAAESRHRFSFLSDKVRLKVFIFSKKKKERERETGLFSVLCARIWKRGLPFLIPTTPSKVEIRNA